MSVQIYAHTPSLPRDVVADDRALAGRVAEFVHGWAYTTSRVRDVTSPARPEDDLRPLIAQHHWRTVLAMCGPDADATTRIVMAVARWAYDEGRRGAEDPAYYDGSPERTELYAYVGDAHRPAHR